MTDLTRIAQDRRMCLTIGLVGAAVLTGLVVWVLEAAGLSLIPLAILTIVVAAGLFWLVDSFCHSRSAAASQAAAGAGQGKPAKKPAPAAGKTGAGAKATAGPGEARAGAKDAAAADRTPAAASGAKADAKTEMKVAAEVPDPGASVETAEEATAADERLDADIDGAGPDEVSEPGARPQSLDAPRDGKPDDLKRIKGVGPKLEQQCHALGFYHYDQIAAWTPEEVAWVDNHLEGFKGRVSRDEWVEQARLLAGGGETDPSAGTGQDAQSRD